MGKGGTLGRVQGEGDLVDCVLSFSFCKKKMGRASEEEVGRAKKKALYTQ